MYNWHEQTYKQQSILWKNPVKDGYGQAIWDYPAQYKCRWRPINELIINDKGEEVISKSKIYIPDSVDVAVGDYIKLGTLLAIDDNSWYDSDYDSDLLSPENIEGAYRILKVDKYPSLCNTITIQVIWI